MHPFCTKKKFYILALIVAILIVFRMILPQILLKQANKFLGEFSPTYSLHMEDLDISIIRGAYRFEKIEGKLKKDNKVFLTIESVDVSMAWREIFKGKIVTDIITDNVYFLFLKDMSQLNPPKKEAKDVKEILFPVKVETVELKRSKIVFEEYPALTDKNRLKIDDIHGIVKNLTPTKKDQISDFNLSAAVQGSTPVKFDGSLNMVKEPMKWNVDVILKDFDMSTLNPVLKRNLPLTFTKGKLDLYVESKNTDKKVVGYIKPFLNDVDVVANKEKFVGIKHFFIEIGVAIGNLFLRDSKSHTVATYVDFNYDGKFNVDNGQALDNAINHGFKGKIKPGLENKYNLDK